MLRQMLDHHLQEGAAQPRIRMQYLKGKPWALQMLAYTASVIVKFMTCSSIGEGWTHWPIWICPAACTACVGAADKLCQAVILCRRLGTPEAHTACAEATNWVGPDG